MRLVGLVRLVAERLAGRVHGDRDVGGLQFVDDAQQRVDEAVDRGHDLPAAPHDQRLAHGEVGAIDDPVAVQDDQARLGNRGRLSLLLGAHRGSIRGPRRASASMPGGRA